MTNNNKDVYGEVFTPPNLINELLDNLPKHVWKTPNLRWLDPCAGKGNFFDEVIPRLMTGLEKSRTEVLGMLTMVELNPNNVKSLRRKYGTHVNIIQGDFLNDEIVSVHTLYDVILGNPPYQSPKHTKREQREGSWGKHTLWDAFVKKAFQLGNQTTVYGWITPSNWRSPGHSLNSLLFDKLYFLHIFNKASGIQHFGVQTRFDIYVLHGKGDASRPIPLIVDEKGDSHIKSIVPKKWPFLPNFAYNSIRRILVDPTTSGDGINVIHDYSTYDSRKLTDKLTSKHRIPIVHTLTQQGVGLRYADNKSAEHFVPKVILNFNERQYPINDAQGKFGMSQLSFGIPIRSREEGQRIIRGIESPTFQEILKATKWASYQTDHRMFAFFHRKFYNMMGMDKGERNRSPNKTRSHRKRAKRSTKRMV